MLEEQKMVKQQRLRELLQWLCPFILCLFSAFTFGQQSIEIGLEWEDEVGIMKTVNTEYEYPVLKNSFVNGDEFLFLEEFKRSSISSNWNLTLLDYQTAPAPQVLKDFLQHFQIKAPTSPTFNIKNNSKAGRPTAVLTLVPFVELNGALKIITGVQFQKNISPIYQTKATTFAPESVLKSGSGSWYKIAVKENGIHRIDYAFLKDLGIDVDGVQPDQINIYGNSFGKLPELNSIDQPDDLIKNDIFIKGDGDGSFDANDYILFYGKGPDKWQQDGSYFKQVRNIYSRESIYFINISPSTSPARIQNAPNVSSPANQTVTDYSSYAIHEEDTRNLMKSGQRWYGEKFDATLSQNVSLFVPNLKPNSDARIRGYMACKEGGGSTNFKVKQNGSTIGTAGSINSSDDSFGRDGFVTQSPMFNPSSNTISLNVKFNRVSPSDAGYLDFLEINARSYLKFYNGIEFRDLNSVAPGNVSEFQMSNFSSNGVVWDITTPTNPALISGTTSGTTFRFREATDSLHSFIGFDGSSYKTPTFIKKINNQNLHGLAQADYLIVTHPRFSSQAQRLAQLHENQGLSVHVVTTTQIYNEFSSGMQDPTAIKFFAKMFYQRAGGDISKQPKYLLLFGDATYDPLNRVSNNNYMVPSYETIDSEGYTNALVSDDYFGFLDDAESFDPSDLLDIAVGRFVATTRQDAKLLVDKVELYMKNGSDLFASNDLSCEDDGYISTHGDWRLKYTLIGDDEESGYFLINDLEPASTYVEVNHPEMNVTKIYADAFVQTTTAGGERYPEVNDRIQRNLETGSLVTCYVGHGGSRGAAEERIMTVGEVKALENIDRLTLFVSSTCEFARIDDNERVSIGEYMALNEIGGAIALMTTTRAVYFSTNTITTEKFFNTVFTKNGNEEPLTFGEIIMQTKNAVTGGSNNKRSFMLLGDPALQIALPYEKVVLDSVNNVDVSLVSDTIRALSKVRMRGHIEDQYGNDLSSFDGVIQPSVYDKKSETKTLGQDATSDVITFKQQENVLFKGKASVTNGVFDFDFIVPKDIDYDYGSGKAIFYAWAENDVNAGGYSDKFYIGGIDTNGLDDQVGPEIELFLNDDSFVNGGITDETPILIANLFDESGINTVGNGIGHDITMIIDENTSDAIVLNDYYESNLDTYQKGELRYPTNKLSQGKHTLTFKVWDVNNNSSDKTLEFVVQKKQKLALDHILNYPNPFTTHTEFFFEHNQVCSSLQTQIEVYTVTGRLVKTINKMVKTRGFRTEGIPWNGKDEFGDQLAKGVYVYRLTVINPEGDQSQEMQKIYLLK